MRAIAPEKDKEKGAVENELGNVHVLIKDHKAKGEADGKVASLAPSDFSSFPFLNHHFLL